MLHVFIMWSYAKYIFLVLALPSFSGILLFVQEIYSYAI